MSKTTKSSLAKKRNSALFDAWSVVHFMTAVALAVILDPFLAIIILIAWEPLEIFILSPLLAKIGVTFGRESLRNVMSDIVFDLAGVLFAVFVVRGLA